MLAPPAIYAAAQIAGLTTPLDSCLSATHRGIQFSTPDGRPICHQGFWDGIEAIPAEIRADLARLADIDRRRTVGYGWGAPQTGRADAVAEAAARGDDAIYRQCQARIAAWVSLAHQEVAR
jgi:hypothetical protein